jgi:hypothetical protein
MRGAGPRRPVGCAPDRARGSAARCRTADFSPALESGPPWCRASESARRETADGLIALGSSHGTRAIIIALVVRSARCAAFPESILEMRESPPPVEAYFLESFSAAQQLCSVGNLLLTAPCFPPYCTLDEVAAFRDAGRSHIVHPHGRAELPVMIVEGTFRSRLKNCECPTLRFRHREEAWRRNKLIGESKLAPPPPRARFTIRGRGLP